MKSPSFYFYTHSGKKLPSFYFYTQVSHDSHIRANSGKELQPGQPWQSYQSEFWQGVT